MLKLSITNSPRNIGQTLSAFLKRTVKKLNVPNGNTNILAFHMFGLNACVHH